jgi:hypothetical protein
MCWLETTAVALIETEEGEELGWVERLPLINNRFPIFWILYYNSSK